MVSARVFRSISLFATVAASKPCPDYLCDVEGDEGFALLQTNQMHRDAQGLQPPAPSPGASVDCTYDSKTKCAGNQCCPQSTNTSGKTYPCPSADASWDGCETGITALLQHPPTPAPPAPAPGASVDCTYDSNTKCAGNQCCPRSTNTSDKTYPCPSADAGWDGCETGIAALLQEAHPHGGGAHVKCPYSGAGCAGNQCCPKAAQTGGKTFPCPSADPNWNKCQAAAPQPLNKLGEKCGTCGSYPGDAGACESQYECAKPNNVMVGQCPICQYPAPAPSPAPLNDLGEKCGVCGSYPGDAGPCKSQYVCQQPNNAVMGQCPICAYPPTTTTPPPVQLGQKCGPDYGECADIYVCQSPPQGAPPGSPSICAYPR